MACPSTRTRSRDRRHGPPRPTPRAARRRPSQRETRLKMAAFFLGGEGHYPRTPLAGDRRRRGRVARKCAPLHRGRSRECAVVRWLVPQPRSAPDRKNGGPASCHRDDPRARRLRVHPQEKHQAARGPAAHRLGDQARHPQRLLRGGLGLDRRCEWSI